MLRKSIMLATVLIIPFAFAEDTSDVKALKKGMPQDVTVLIDRIVQCNRWRGEEPSTKDKERIEKVKKELEKWQCDAISKDQETLTKLYKNNYEVKTRIQDAQSIF
jgi:hypothetical protein